MKKFFLLFVLFALTGCNCHHLTVQTLYFTRESLASYYVETPDPMLLNPPVGQRLLITWSLPFHYLGYNDLHLNVRIRFRNLEEVELDIPIEKTCGSYMYTLLNERYFETEGILTYKVDLMGDGQILEEWRHQLWHELIKIGDQSESSPP